MPHPALLPTPAQSMPPERAPYRGQPRQHGALDRSAGPGSVPVSSRVNLPPRTAP
ncbi:hypothetical protein SSAG_00081 [Streptomyces sp. Mg1]|nr:hypothetical protein SSAG_00081 [Streptomyces sp. Mg1]